MSAAGAAGRSASTPRRRRSCPVSCETGVLRDSGGKGMARGREGREHRTGAGRHLFFAFISGDSRAVKAGQTATDHTLHILPHTHTKISLSPITVGAFVLLAKGHQITRYGQPPAECLTQVSSFDSKRYFNDLVSFNRKGLAFRCPLQKITQTLGAG